MVFRICADEGRELVDTKDLRATLIFISDNRKEYEGEHGIMSVQSLGAIRRSVMSPEDAGGDIFFGRPALDTDDWFRTDSDGRGAINILHSVKLAHNPKLYSTFVVWLLNDLFTTLPEVGDMEKPKSVFFFDDAPPVLARKVEQAVKPIRSKGMGIYFISQSLSDILVPVLFQFGNRVQHAFRAYTPKDRRRSRSWQKYPFQSVFQDLGFHNGAWDRGSADIFNRRRRNSRNSGEGFHIASQVVSRPDI